MPGASQLTRSINTICAVLLVLSGCTSVAAVPAQAQAPRPRIYEIDYIAEIESGNEIVKASIRIGSGAKRFREMRFDFDPALFSDFSGDGEVVVEKNRLTWKPPRSGGTLEYRVKVARQRKNGGYDALIAKDWALFRGGDLFPPAATRVLSGSKSRARLVLDMPRRWSAVTRFRSAEDENTFRVIDPQRNFDRPTGWIVAGKLGVRRGKIAGKRVAIAGPVGQGLRRMDIMAFLRWTLPGLVDVFSAMDDRVVIVGAGNPMWRGGLSGPGSLYVHADRPLISENGTSTFLHELVHVAMGASGDEHDDWLLEGLAEYYSIKLLHTSGSLSRRRMTLTLEDQRRWGEEVDDLFVRHSTGAVTARAVTLLAALDAALDGNGPGDADLDTVVATMIENEQPYSYAALCVAARHVMMGPVRVLQPSRVPGAPDIEVCR